ncbi:hypothetical protein EV645_1292 [Kribbella rubisoli]|uniref:ATP/GTP-binding protein n=1 Tax=Kribbella rubisoli TaxID=3075929 RepID=A0A4V2FYV6_9ACTN|nr:hypothetical protein [Kribbella rubisoli]RZU19086.1 hypothetical protein EV645_1292 [Kribbella rubisoli]
MLIIKLFGVVAILSVVGVSAAVADPTPVAPGCVTGWSAGQCVYSVGDDGHPPTERVKATPGAKKPGASACVFEGQVVPCRTKDGFFDAASGCYLYPLDAPRSLDHWTAISDYPPGTRFYGCWKILGVVDGKPVGELTLESVNRPPGATRTIDPREAARRVVATMKFVAPQLGLSPYVQSVNHVGIVNVPVWMWVTDPGSTTTGPQTKRAAIGGVGIEATGTVERIEWAMGAGKTVTCKGAGTPFTKVMAAGKSLKDMPSSPTCGYRYAKTSRCEKGGTFTVTATAYWNVHWTGGGMEGDIPLDFSRSIPLQVTDLRPVLVDPDGGSSTPSVAPQSCSN